jgi:hypothetical protein
MKSHLYLLAHTSGTRFKIGKANDIIERARCFGLGEIDWANSAGFALESPDVALHLERILLRAFTQWRLTPAEVLAAGGKRDGATEWMRSDCWDRAEEFLTDVQDLYPHARICGHALNRQVDELLAPALQAIALRDKRRAEKEKRDAVRATLRHAQTLASRAILETSLTKARDNFWRELERHASEGTIVGLTFDDYGCSLVLLGEPGNERLWQSQLQDTFYSWPGGAGGLIHSVSECSVDGARVCLVGLGKRVYDDWLVSNEHEHVPHPSLAFLRSLTTVDCETHVGALDRALGRRR